MKITSAQQYGLRDTASWVVVEIKTNQSVFETYSKQMVNNLNTKKFKAVPVQEWLGSLNNKEHP
jgi:hypothetical protein